MLENGVGLLPLLMDEFYSAWRKPGDRRKETGNHHCHGNGAEEYIRGFLDDAIKKFPHISGRVAPIVNRFLGRLLPSPA